MRALLSRVSSPKRVLAFVGAFVSFITIARAVVLVVESYSAVRSERVADAELMQVCDSGHASQSNDFRALCIKKRADRASPILLKAVLRAVKTAFQDFAESLSSPWRVMILLLFILSGIAAPVVRATCTIFTEYVKGQRRHEHPSDDELSDYESHAQIWDPREAPRLRFGSRLRRRVVKWGRGRMAPRNGSVVDYDMIGFDGEPHLLDESTGVVTLR